MAWLRQSFLRLACFFRRAQLDQDLDAEINSHLQLGIEENLRAGMSPAEARRRALIQFGGTQQAKELHRDSAASPGSKTSSRTCVSHSACFAKIPASPPSP